MLITKGADNETHLSVSLTAIRDTSADGDVPSAVPNLKDRPTKYFRRAVTVQKKSGNSST